METWKRPRKERGLTHTFSLYLYATITPRLLTDCLEQVSVAWARTQVTAQSFAFPPPPPRSATTGVSDRGSLSTNVVIWGAIGKLNFSPSCNNRGINLGDSMEESISSNAADAGEVKENETKKERPTSLDLDKCDAGNDEEVKIQDGKKSSTTRLPAQI